MIELNSKLQIRQGLRLQWEAGQDCWVLLFPEGMIQLNQTAAVILQQFQTPTEVKQAISQLQKQYSGQDIQDDIMEFLEDAHGQRWLSIR